MLPTPSRREAPAARDVDDAAPLVAAEGRLAATWAENPDAARAGAASASGLVMLCHSLLLAASRRLSPASSSSLELYGGIVTDLATGDGGFT